MFDEGIVIGKAVAIVPSEGPKMPDLLIVKDSSRPEYPNTIACEFFGEKTRALLAKVGPGEIVRVVGSIRSNQGKQGGWFTHFSAFSVMNLQHLAEAKAEALGFTRGRTEDLPF